jgi:peroxiredoxin
MNKTKIIIAVLFSLSIFSAGLSVRKGYEPGDSASDFRLRNVDGKMVSMADYGTSKGFIIIFDCNTCPYSKAYNNRIISLSKKYAPLGFQVIAINSNDPAVSSLDSFDEMIKEAKKKNYDFPYLVDASQEVARTYGATNTPHVFVLNKTGNNYVVAYIGAIDDNARDASAAKKKYVENAVDALLSGKEVEVKRTRALGCGIKWKNS